MPLAELLFSVLTAGAQLLASGAVSEFAKGAGKAAFEALKDRLTGQHAMRSVSLLEDAATNPAFAAAIKTELESPAVANDGELLRLAEALRAAIAALPQETQARYAVDIEQVQSGGSLLFEAIEGVKAKTATSVGDMTFKNVSAPPGK